MVLNNNKIERWKTDTMESVDFYNNWFMEFAPKAYRDARMGIIKKVEKAMAATGNFTDISVEKLLTCPGLLATLRMATAPPLARDRLAGLSCSDRTLVKRLESDTLQHIVDNENIRGQVSRMSVVLRRMLDTGIMPWLSGDRKSRKTDLRRCAAIIADRLNGALADPIIRNEQEKRQLAAISSFLEKRNYVFIPANEVPDFREMPERSFTLHLNVPVNLPTGKSIKMPVDVVVSTDKKGNGQTPILIECKSAGDFANTNKRRKEEAVKASQLRATYGSGVNFLLFLCGYFDPAYLGYEAAEGIDWVWEHRISDLLEIV